MLLSFIPLPSQAIEEPTSKTLSIPIDLKTAKNDELIIRLGIIKEIDKSALKASEKKNLRKEVRTIQKELKERNGGIYISVGAAIVIVVLIIVLL